MADYITIATVDEFPNSGDRIVVEVNNHVIAVFMVSGRFYAIEDVCSHDDGPLADGELRGNVIECARHGAQFDITTGKVLKMPAITGIPAYEIKIDGNDVQILI